VIGTFWLLRSRYTQAVYQYTGLDPETGKHRWDRCDGLPGFMLRQEQAPACLRRLPRSAARKQIRNVQKIRAARQRARDLYWRRLGAVE